MPNDQKELIKNTLFKSLLAKYPITEAYFNEVWEDIDRTGIVEALIEKKRSKAVPGLSTMDLDQLEGLVSDDLEKNNRIALEMIKRSNFNRELVNTIYNGLGAVVEMGKEGTYGEGIQLKRKLNLQQFYTNSAVSDLIQKLLEINQFARVFDPTCGSGRLFFRMPNPQMVHGIEIESDAYAICRALYPGGQIIQDNTMHHMYEREFDYVVANPPFTMFWEDKMRLFKFTSYNNRIVSEVAVMESSIRSLKDGGYLAIVMPSDVWMNKFYDKVDFVQWLRTSVDCVAKVDLPTKTHEGTVWPVSLYVFRKTNDYYKPGWESGKESRIPTWTFTGKLNTFEEVEINRVVKEWKESREYNKASEYSRHKVVPQEPLKLDVVVYKEITQAEYLRSAVDIKSEDQVELDAIVAELESFILPPITIIPNGLHADLKVNAIRSKFPYKWSPSRKEYVDEFKQQVANLDGFLDERKPYDTLPLVNNLHTYDCAIQLSDNFKAAMEKRKEWIKFQNAPFEVWVDENSDFNWQLMFENDGYRTAYPEIYTKWKAKFEVLQNDPRYDVMLPFIGRKGNWMKHLFEYQKEDVIKLAIKASAIHAGQMGLGKTRSAIAVALLKGWTNTLIVCKKKIVQTWFEEFDQLGLERPFLVETMNDTKHMLNHLFVITTMEALRTTSGKKGKKRANPETDPEFNYDYKSEIELEQDVRELLEGFDFAEEEVDALTMGVPVYGTQNPRKKSEGEETKEAERIKKLQTRKFFADQFTEKFGLMIVDEAHDLQNPLTYQTQAVWRVAPKHVLFLTGTPIKNRVKGLLSLLVIGWGEGTTANPYTKAEFLDHFMQKKKVEYEVADSHGFLQKKEKEIEIPQIANPDDLRTLMAGKWLRRTKYEPDVSNNIKFPKPLVNFIEIQPSEEERVYAKQWYDELQRLKREVMEAKKRLKALRQSGNEDPELEAELKVKSAICVIMIGKLRAVALCPQINWLRTKTAIMKTVKPKKEEEEEELEEEQEEAEPEIEEELTALQKHIHIPNPYNGGITPKQQQILDELKTRVKAGEQCYTICDFPDFNREYLYKWLTDAGVRTEVIDGSVSQDRRNDIIQRFRDKKVDIILATIGTFDVGINIPAASYCCIMMPTWNWSDMEQAYNRMIRPQSKGERNVDVMILKNTIEDYVNQLLQMKRFNLNYVLDYGPRPPDQKWFSWTDAVNAMFVDMEKGVFSVE